MSVVHIIYPETMDEQKQKPREQGLNDLHTPVFHVGFVVKIKKLLETVCHTCGLIKADFVSLPT